MKKTRYSLIAIAALAALGASSAMANPFIAPAEPAESKIIWNQPTTYELGFTTYREKYTERVDGKKFMQEEANMWGVQGAVTHSFNHGGKLKLSGIFATGNADYTGAYQGGNYGDLRVGSLDRYMLTTELEYKLTSRDWNDITFGAGVGYRRLVDHLEQAGPGGYKRKNDRVYLTLGLEREFLAGDWSFTPQFKYKHLVWGSQHSDIMGGVAMKQDKGYGTELAVAITHKAAWNGLTVTPYLRTWDIKNSKFVQLTSTVGAYEPQNKTKEVGVTVSLRF